MKNQKTWLAVILVVLAGFLIFPWASNAADTPSLPTPIDYLYALGDDVISSVDHKGIENSLLAKLDTAIQKLDDNNENNDIAAVKSLEAFINAVQAQSGKKIPQADADYLIADAQQIIVWLEGTPPVWVRDAVIVSRFEEIAVEIEGRDGRISVPVDMSERLRGLSGLAAQGETVYALISSYDRWPFPYGTTHQQLLTLNLVTGLVTKTVDIELDPNAPGKLYDIAVLDGHVYGSWRGQQGDVVKIRRIEPGGTLTDVWSQPQSGGSIPYPPLRPLIAANTQANVVVLALTSSPFSGFAPTYYVVDPADWMVSHQVTVPEMVLSNMIMRNDGQHLVVDTAPFYSFEQTILSIPDFTVEGVLYRPYTLGSTSIPALRDSFISDEFYFAYDASFPAVATLANSNYSGTDLTGKKLFRKGQIAWQFDTNITNYAVPDGTVIDMVGLKNFSWAQSAGTPVQITTELEPVGDLSLRKLMHNEFELNVDTAQRGVYELRGQIDLQGRYITNGIESERPIHVNNSLVQSFAVDPVSDNLVGNGDFTLSDYGWNHSGLVVSDHEVSSRADVLWMTPVDFSPDEVSQSLELPLSGNMILSFEYRNRSFPGDSCSLLVTLEGKTIAEINGILPSLNYQQFVTSINDLDFEGLSDAVLEFQATSTGSSWLYIDNIHLTLTGGE